MSPNPKVGYVLKMYPRFSETFIITEILAHEAAGFEIEIFSLRLPNDGKFHEALARVKAPVTYLQNESLKAADFWSTLRDIGRQFPQLWPVLAECGTEQVDEVYQAALLARAAAARGITHLHAHFASVATTVARLAARIAGLPYSFTAHAKDIFHEEVRGQSLRAKLRDAAAVVTVSDFNLDYLNDTFGSDAAAVHRIYNGLDLDEFTYEAPAKRSRTILAIGRLIEKKGFEDLIDACAVLASRGTTFDCEIIGAGPLYATLAAQIERLNLGDIVRLVGAQPRGEVIARLRNAGVLAAPCVIGADGNRDGLPTVLLEAMALGTPCVSTDVTGIPELVRHDETGLIVPQHDPNALAEALQRLLDDRELASNFAAAARRLIEAEFDIDRNTATMRELFHPNIGVARELAEAAVA